MPNWIPGVIVVLILFPLLMWAWTYLAVRWLAFVWRLLTARRGDLLLPVFVAVVGAAGFHGIANAGNGIMRDGFEPEGWCPAGRVTQTVVSWRYDGIGRRGTDVTLADNIWGRSTASGPSVGYPWLNYYAIFWAMPRHGYIAARFDVPPWALPTQWGMFTHGETLPGPATDMAISDRCGDFNPPEDWCLREGTVVAQRMGTYKQPEAPLFAGCELPIGGSYYINIRLTDPNVVHGQCSGAACQHTIQNNHTP